MAGPIELVKKHPLASGAAIIAVIAVVFLLSGDGGGGEPDASAGGVNNDAAIAMAQFQSQQQGQQLSITASRDVALAENATARYMADLEAQTNSASIAANLQLGSQQLALNAQSTDLANTLAAKISGDQIKAQSDAAAMNYATLQQQIASSAAISQAAINAQVSVAKINKPKRGLFSKIFG